MAKGSKQKTVSTQAPPAWIDAAYKGVLGKAADVASKPYQKYTGEFVAPLTTAQKGGIAQVTENANYAQPYIEQGLAGAEQAYDTLQPQLDQALTETGAAADTGAALNEAAASYYAGAMPSADPYLDAAEQTAAGATATGAAYTDAAGQGLAGAQDYSAPYNEAATGQAIQAYQGAQPYQGSATDYATAGAQAVDPTQFSGEQLQQYISPYMQQVYQATLANINEQNASQMNQLRGNAIAKGAFGGDRAGIAAAEMARQQNLASQSTLSGVLQQGYDQAIKQFNQQQGVNLGANQANREANRLASTQMSDIGKTGYEEGMGLSKRFEDIGAQGYGQGVTTAKTASDIGNTAFNQGQTQAAFEKGLGTTNYDMGMGTGKAAQGLGESMYDQGMKEAAQRATLAGQGYTAGTGTAKTIADLGTAGQTAALSGGAAAIQAGGVEQANKQALDTAKYNEFLAEQAYPFQSTQFLSDITQGIGGQAGGTTTQQGVTSQKGSTASSILGGLGSAADIYNTATQKQRGGAVDGYAAGGEIGMIPYEFLRSGLGYMPKRVKPSVAERIFPGAARAPEPLEPKNLDLGSIAQSVRRAVQGPVEYNPRAGLDIDLDTLLSAETDFPQQQFSDRLEYDLDTYRENQQRDQQRRDQLAQDLIARGYDLGYGGRVDYADGGMPSGMVAIPVNKHTTSPKNIFPGAMKAPEATPVDYDKMGESLGKIAGTIGSLSQDAPTQGSGTITQKPTTLEGLGTLQGQSDRQSGSFLDDDPFSLDDVSNRHNFAEGGLAGMPTGLLDIPHETVKSASNPFPKIQQPEGKQGGGGGILGSLGKIVKMGMSFIPGMADGGGVSDENIMDFLAKQETGGMDDPYTATNPDSTAFGKYQIIEPTYNGIIRNNPDAGLPKFSDLGGDPAAQEKAGGFLLGEYKDAADKGGFPLTLEVAGRMHNLGVPEYLRQRGSEPGLVEPVTPGLAPTVEKSPDVVVPPEVKMSADPVAPDGLGASRREAIVSEPIQIEGDKRGGIERLLGVNFSPEAETGMRAAFASMLGGENIGRGILTGMGAYTAAQQRGLEKQKMEAEQDVARRRVATEETNAATAKARAETEEAQRRFTQATGILSGYKNLNNGTYLTPYGTIISAAEFAQVRDRLLAGPKSGITPSGAIPVPSPVAEEPKTKEPRSDFSVAKEYDPVWINYRLAENAKETAKTENSGFSTAPLTEEKNRLEANSAAYKAGDNVRQADGSFAPAKGITDTIQKNKYEKETAPAQLKVYQEEQPRAQEQLHSIGNLVEITANPNTPTGLFAPALAEVARGLSALKLGTDNEAIAANRQIFDKDGAFLSNLQTKSLAEAGVGRVLQIEVAGLGRMLPAFDNEREANLYLLANFGAMQRRKLRLINAYREFVDADSRRTPSEEDKFFAKWQQENPLKKEISDTVKEYSIDPAQIEPWQNEESLQDGHYYSIPAENGAYNQTVVAKKVGKKFELQRVQ